MFIDKMSIIKKINEKTIIIIIVVYNDNIF
jgi:hypothetical protein